MKKDEDDNNPSKILSCVFSFHNELQARFTNRSLHCSAYLKIVSAGDSGVVLCCTVI